MSYAELLGLKKELSNHEIMELLSNNSQVNIDGVTITQNTIKDKDVTGGFGEPTPL